MDNKNVFVAIALSMSVLLFWGAFFETPKNQIEQKTKVRNDLNFRFCIERHSMAKF